MVHSENAVVIRRCERRVPMPRTIHDAHGRAQVQSEYSDETLRHDEKARARIFFALAVERAHVRSVR